MSKLSQTQTKIVEVCDGIKEMLLKKNAKYGDSAVNPLRLFSQASTTEQISVRIDDKLSRIKQSNGKWTDDEDVISDLIGYLVLYKVANSTDKWDGTTIESFPKPSSANSNLEYIHDGIVELYSSGDHFA